MGSASSRNRGRSEGTIRWLACALALCVVAGCRSGRARGVRPTEPDAAIAAQATARGDWRVAAERWWAVWIASPKTDPKPCLEAARALIELRDAESASNLLDEGLRKHAQDADLLEMKARAVAQQGFRRAATEYFERALAADPRRTAARLELGRLRIELGLESAAVQPLREYVAATGGDAASYALLARALRGAGDVSGAYQAWRKAFELAPPRVEDLLSAASLALDPDVRGAHPEAAATCRSWLERAVALDPQCTRAHFQLGLLSEETGAYERAIEHYRRAVETDPSCLKAITNLAILYAGRGDEDHAREMVVRALELERDDERRRELQKLLEPFDRARNLGSGTVAEPQR